MLSKFTPSQVSAAMSFARENNARFMGVMENNDEFVFEKDGTMISRWWIATEKRLGTFEEYTSND